MQAVQRQVVRRRDPALELRSRLAMAVAEEQYDDAATLQVWKSNEHEMSPQRLRVKL